MAEADVPTPDERRWAAHQIDEYKRRRNDYERYARFLRDRLEAAVAELAPHAVVETRTKSVASFGQKAWRKRDRSPNSVDEFTDLCGARVIAHTAAEVEAIADWIEGHFDIDWDNTVDKRQRLRPTEFGYRSVHYIVRVQPSRFADGEALPASPNPRAEIQVRTLLEHAWASASHELVYKRGAPVSPGLLRELAAVAAVLESADASFARVREELVAYAGADVEAMGEDELRAELERVLIVLEHDPENAQLAARVGRLANALGDWKRTERELARFGGSEALAVLRALGEAKCRVHPPGSQGHDEGQRLLERASRLPERDAATLVAYGDSFVDREQAGEWYRRAFELDPSDPAAVVRLVEHELVDRGNESVLRTLGPVVHAAIERGRSRAAFTPSSPGPFYEIGRLALLRGDPFGSLSAYSKALGLTNDPVATADALAALERLGDAAASLRGYEWARRLLLVGLGSWQLGGRAAGDGVIGAFGRVTQMASTGATEEARAGDEVVILAGGSSRHPEAHLAGFRELVLAAFRDFRGTIVSGGTEGGASGLAGDVRAELGSRVLTVGYVPETVPPDAVVDRDEDRYDRVRVTPGDRFSPLQPIQGWIDLVASGVHPAEVKMLGLGGGPISGAEFRIALGLGAPVALVEGSDGAAAEVFDDDDWAGAPGVIRLPDEPHTARAFVESERAAPRMEPELRERIARAIHEQYVRDQAERKPTDDLALANWPELDSELQASNRQQADHVLAKLERLGYAVVPRSSARDPVVSLPPDEIERLAESEHRRWNLERLLGGWTWAPERNVRRRRTPHLGAWNDLPDDVKEIDRQAVRAIPRNLEAAGLQIAPAASADINNKR